MKSSILFFTSVLLLLVSGCLSKHPNTSNNVVQAKSEQQKINEEITHRKYSIFYHCINDAANRFLGVSDSAEEITLAATESCKSEFKDYQQSLINDFIFLVPRMGVRDQIIDRGRITSNDIRDRDLLALKQRLSLDILNRRKALASE